jgi:hypothetical protein
MLMNSTTNMSEGDNMEVIQASNEKKTPEPIPRKVAVEE